MATIQNLTIDQGATFRQVVEWLDESGFPVDLSTYTARMQIRPRNGPALIDLTTENTRIALSAEGEITLTLTATETAALPAGTYYYDLEVAQGSVAYRVIEGAVTINRNITTS